MWQEGDVRRIGRCLKTTMAQINPNPEVLWLIGPAALLCLERSIWVIYILFNYTSILRLRIGTNLYNKRRDTTLRGLNLMMTCQSDTLTSGLRSIGSVSSRRIGFPWGRRSTEISSIPKRAVYIQKTRLSEIG